MKSAKAWRNECEQKVVIRTPMRFPWERFSQPDFVTMTLRLATLFLLLAICLDIAPAQEAKPKAAPVSASTITIGKAPGDVGFGVWVVIGDQDERVSTARVIAFAQAVTKASVEQQVDSRIDLHVLAEPRGHSTPQLATWIGGACREMDAPTNV